MCSVELSKYIREHFPVNKQSTAKRTLVYKRGVNDADYLPSGVVEGKVLMCPAYSAWRGMFKRVLSRRNPTYAGTIIVPEWNSFMAFREWWLENYREGYELDKDILAFPNKIYGPHTAVYIPSHINTFLSDSRKIKGDYPTGVHFEKYTGKYRASAKDGAGKAVRLGRYASPEAALEAWKSYKLSRLESLKEELDGIDSRLYVCMREIISTRK